MLLLKKKRYQEQMLKRTDGQLENLEKMVSELEFSQIQAKVIEGLKRGNESLKKMHEVKLLINLGRKDWFFFLF